MNNWIPKALLTSFFFCLVGCGTTNVKYLEPWNPDYFQTFDDVRIQVVAHGLLAPNAHNKQSWKIVLDRGNLMQFNLYVDTERLLPATDPYYRQIMVSQGTFLELVRISSAELGYLAKVELFPMGELNESAIVSSMKSKPVARVIMEKTDKNPASSLYPEIFKRVTNRTPYFSDPMTDNEKIELTRANSDAPLTLVFFQDSQSLEMIQKLTIEGVRTEASTDRTIKESQEVFRDSEKEKNQFRDGITMMSGGLSGAKLHIMQFLSNTFPISLKKFGEFWIDSEMKNINSAPTFAMIISSENSRETQVKVGMLYARLQLSASKMGISVHPLSQTLQEFPEMALLYQTVHESFAESGQTIQMLFRMGRATKEVNHSPRRDAMDLISQP